MVAPIDTAGERFVAKPQQKCDEEPCNAKVARLVSGDYTVTRHYLAIQLIGIICNTWMHFKPGKVTADMVREDFKRDVRGLVLCTNVLGFQLKHMKLDGYATTFSELVTWHTLLLLAVSKLLLLP